MSSEAAARGGLDERVDRVSRRANGALATLAAIAVLSIMLLTVVNMVLRFAGAPIAGSFELVGWLAALTNGLAVGYTQTRRGHVDIDVLTRLMPLRIQAVLRAVMTGVATGFFVIVTWQLVEHGLHLRDVGSLSDVLRVPFYPFTFAVAVGFAGFVLALFADLLRHGREAMVPRREGDRTGWTGTATDMADDDGSEGRE
ncbi:TRAP transporter small permease [Egibacter rhizosphaerae]|uniref:TRAP transporter small permease n=1 Tax=Egibacter rhizosphaerae TaxID=1670831 RepID=A0A411YGS2_9ACTN|nr:TRAP transporter small permease [Egibacter rhizosphaerae]QBI20403.1 TRAP transporter small permease [Egibacter rhizosphaerae]